MAVSHAIQEARAIAYVPIWVSSVEYSSPKLPPSKVMFMFHKDSWMAVYYMKKCFSKIKTKPHYQNQCTILSTEVLKIKGFMPSSALFWFFPKDMKNKWLENGTFSYIPAKSKKKAGQIWSKSTYLNQNKVQEVCSKVTSYLHILLANSRFLKFHWNAGFEITKNGYSVTLLIPS